jgi:YVTN family beta-propeller protein
LRSASLFLAGCVILGGCRHGATGPGKSTGAGSAVPTAAKSNAGPLVAEPPKSASPMLRGSVLALTPDETTLLVADEDHEALFSVPASLEHPELRHKEPLPGPPGQLVALADRIVVTVRTLPTEESRKARQGIWAPAGARVEPTAPPPDTRGSALPEPAASPGVAPSSSSAARAPRPTRREKRIAAVNKGKTRPRNTPPRIFDPTKVRESTGGALLVLERDGAGKLVERGRVVLPPDAWGLAVLPGETRALVTSAWSAQVSLVDLTTLRVLAAVATAREPRGIAVTPDGKRAYVSHLVGSALSVLDLGPASLTLRSLDVPPAPARTPPGARLEASLGYDLVLAPDAKTLFLPRHALGAEGVGSWWGAPTIDALDLESEKNLAPARGKSPGAQLVAEYIRPSMAWEASAGQPPPPLLELVQPRAVAYRRATDTLLVASEGSDSLTEVDALAPDPSLGPERSWQLGDEYDPFGGFPDVCGGPAGLALSRDDMNAYVYCRTTFDVVRVELETDRRRIAHLTDDGLPADASYGRRLFANATIQSLSGGLGCAACHPEGRDDGYVWREGNLSLGPEPAAYFVGRRENVKLAQPGAPPPEQGLHPPVFPRQTPMIAGRVRSHGPYGWHGESDDIVSRLLLGSRLHSAPWQSAGLSRDEGSDVARLDYLIDYLVTGLLPPPTLVHPLDEQEQRGKAIFESDETRCSRCHVPASEFTDRGVLPLPRLPVRPGFDPEPNPAFKTPSLWFVAGTSPYFHDGSRATLEELIASNHDRMGKTSHLSEEDRSALVAYLRTL